MDQVWLRSEIGVSEDYMATVQKHLIDLQVLCQPVKLLCIV